MNFIKSVSKTVGDGVKLVTLDDIVEDILKNHEKEMNAYVSSREDFLSPEEAETVEALWFATRHQSYDKRVKNALGKNIPENWHEDKDLICVRKRILNRGLEKAKGQLLIRMAQKNESSKALYLEVLKSANVKLSQRVEQVTVRLPLGSSDLDQAIDLNVREIKNEVKVSTPNIDDLAQKFSDASDTDPYSSWTALLTKIDSSVTQLQTQNTAAINAVIGGLKNTHMENLKCELAAIIQQEQDRFVESLKAKGIVSDMQALSLQMDLTKQLDAHRVTMNQGLDTITLSI